MLLQFRGREALALVVYSSETSITREPLNSKQKGTAGARYCGQKESPSSWRGIGGGAGMRVFVSQKRVVVGKVF